MHNARSLLGGIKFHLSGSVEARANLCRAAPSGVTYVCIVRAWGYFRQRWPTPTTRCNGEADIICIHVHLPTHKQTNTYRSAGLPVSIQFMLLADHTETIDRCLWPVGVGLNYKCRLRPILMSVGQSPPLTKPLRK